MKVASNYFLRTIFFCFSCSYCSSAAPTLLLQLLAESWPQWSQTLSNTLWSLACNLSEELAIKVPVTNRFNVFINWCEFLSILGSLICSELSGGFREVHYKASEQSTKCRPRTTDSVSPHTNDSLIDGAPLVLFSETTCNAGSVTSMLFSK